MHEWFRHSALDTSTIFQNRFGVTRSVHQDNRYGLSLGAPVIIPKVYNGTNKTHWFLGFWAAKLWHQV